MFPWNPHQWTEDYLASLIGQSESARLEYKSGKGLLRKEDRDKFVREQLSPTLSAFANSEGGILIIGMDEDRHVKPRVAKELDGVRINKGEAIESKEQFQQIVDACISPYLPGIRIKDVALAGHLADRVALVVYVPQGTTAYQAKDHIYYSRSEFETKSMPDHEVRLRMFRGRIAQARVGVIDGRLLTSETEWIQRAERVKVAEANLQAEAEDEGINLVARRHLEEAKKALEAPRRTFDEYSFRLAVTNSGEVTIRDFLLSLKFETPFRVLDLEKALSLQGIPSDTKVQTDRELKFRFMKGQHIEADFYSPPEQKIFPGDQVSFPDKNWVIHIPRGALLTVDNFVLHWAVYLDDAPPISGKLNLADYLQYQSLGA